MKTIQIAPDMASAKQPLIPQDKSDMSDKSKRPKACTNCRKSKTKCIKADNDQICKRCRSQGLQCIYEYKVASYKVASGSPKDLGLLSTSATSDIATSKLTIENNNTSIPIKHILNPVNSIQRIPKLSTAVISNKDSKILNNNWENSVEERLEGFGSQLNTILSLLQNKHPEINNLNNNNNKREIEDIEGFNKRQKIVGSPVNVVLSKPPSTFNYSISKTNELDDDSIILLENVLNKENTEILFEFFNKNISPQLFGFDISQYSIENIWKTCPLLIATITCISSIHHPTLNHLSPKLEKIVYDLSKNILYKLPQNEIEAFNTIIALCFCGFWFKNNQMFTGLAVQLARTMNLIDPRKISKDKKNIIPKKDRLKLWYLLYILDGQQSLVFNRQSIIDSNDITLKNSKDLLLAAENENYEKSRNHENENNSNNKIPNFNNSYENIRLISQVEYHQAINAVFEGQAWDLLTPSSFGLPFKTNLELDKWMVQWTVLLSPFKNHPVWSSKSTLIYYNFAKIHINSSAVRNFQTDGSNLPKFSEIDDDFSDIIECDDNNKYIESANEELNNEKINDDENTDDDDDSEDDDNDLLDLAKELSPLQSKKVSAELALSAAETVLNIVLGDADILSVLKYVPIHIHIMLYYSALLILKPHACLNGEGQSFDKYNDEESRFEASLNAIKLVKRLRHSIIANLPTDREFSEKIITGLTEVLQGKVRQMREEIGTRRPMLDKLDRVVLDNDALELYKSVRRRREEFKISAWPGFDAGHPTKSKK
jgi:hypothetical protein